MSEDTYESIAERYGVTMRAEPIAADLNPFGQTFGSGSRHFSIMLGRPGRKPFQCFYAQGSAIKREPSPADLLECLVLDMLSHEGDYWTYVDEFGVEPSRDGQARYELGVDQSRRFAYWADGPSLDELLAVEA